MLKDKIYGVRDPYGNRPLCIGKIVPINLGDRKDSDDLVPPKQSLTQCTLFLQKT